MKTDSVKSDNHYNHNDGLSSFREQIDRIDGQMTALFEERMELVGSLAEYKKEKGIAIFHSEREKQVIERASSRVNGKFKTGISVLFSTLMELSKVHQKSLAFGDGNTAGTVKGALKKPPVVSARPKMACPGIEDSYSHQAAQLLFPNSEIAFYPNFEDIFEAVDHDTVECGILPIENSSAGSVVLVYSLLQKYNFYVNHGVKLKIEHCIAAKPGIPLESITDVYSHQQALSQCSEFFSKHSFLRPQSFANTAMAARFVANSDEPIAAICSVSSAKRYGLEILKSNIQNVEENYTRFICISKNLELHEDRDLISVSLAISNEPNSLYRLLTKFAAAGVNMTKILSSPIGNKNFDVIFYIDFNGDVRDEPIINLINDLEQEFPTFKFFGNYKEIAE